MCISVVSRLRVLCIESVVQSLFIGDSEDVNEPAAGTVEDADGRDYVYEDFMDAIILEGQQFHEDEDEDEPIEVDEPLVSDDGEM